MGMPQLSFQVVVCVHSGCLFSSGSPLGWSGSISLLLGLVGNLFTFDLSMPNLVL